MFWLYTESYLKYIFTMQLSMCNYLTKVKCWWAQVDSNHRPHAYQACALTS